MSDYYDRQGNPISIQRWALLFKDKGYQIVRQTMIGEVKVSTVWLGIDHGFGTLDRPVIFETMVFGPEREYEEMYRYETESEALAEHAKIVEQLRTVERALR